MLDFSRTDSVSCKWKPMRVRLVVGCIFGIGLWTRAYEARLEVSLARLYRVIEESFSRTSGVI